MKVFPTNIFPYFLDHKKPPPKIKRTVELISDIINFFNRIMFFFLNVGIHFILIIN